MSRCSLVRAWLVHHAGVTLSYGLLYYSNSITNFDYIDITIHYDKMPFSYV